MTNKFYRQNEQRAARVNDLFTAIAPRYDLINDLQSFGLHRLWKRRLVRMANVRPGEITIDLCCGTGDLALAFARQGARVVGLDFNQPMLAVAESRSQKAMAGDRKYEPNAATSSLRLAPAIFLRGDALQIPFSDNSFGVVVVGYGLRNLASWEAGLREMLRVARPGGRLLVLDFGKPDLALWRWFYFTYLRLFVPVLGRIFCGNAAAYAYILESLKHYPAQRGVAAKMHELGLRNVRIINFAGGIMSINYGEKAKSN